MKIFSALKKHHPFKSSERCLDLSCHIVAAQEIWHARIAGRQTTNLNLWPAFESWAKLKDRLNHIHQNWLHFLKGSEKIGNRTTSYKNSKGTAFEMKTADILQHLIIHGQHHRAQIALLLRNADIKPPSTDYLYYLRETNNK